jgi:hypothetical protein
LVSNLGFDHTFNGCTSLTSIPLELFDKNINCNSWNACFYNCTSLDGDAPDLWIDYPTANGTSCFEGCIGLDNFASIPTSWGGPSLGAPLQMEEKSTSLSGEAVWQERNNRGQLASQLKVYPNPANGILNIESPYEKYNTSLYDYTGKCVLNQASYNKETLNIAHLRKGIYLLVVEADGKQETTKITIE